MANGFLAGGGGMEDGPLTFFAAISGDPQDPFLKGSKSKGDNQFEFASSVWSRNLESDSTLDGTLPSLRIINEDETARYDFETQSGREFSSRFLNLVKSTHRTKNRRPRPS